jgi:hypothetical protein
MLTFTDIVAIVLVILFASLFVSISFKFSIAESFAASPRHSHTFR